MTVAEQKAALLDIVIQQIKECDDINYIGVLADYEAIQEPITFTEDPYIDEVFDGRIISLLKDKRMFKYWHKNMRVSDLPNPVVFESAPGWGRVAIRKYTEVFNKYRG